MRWLESYLSEDLAYCVYIAEGEAVILEHSRLSGFPANKFTEAVRKIDPMTAEG